MPQTFVFVDKNENDKENPIIISSPEAHKVSL